ncbi:hypothetical protein TNCV_5019141 [Trichonephila clavipes]|nr:hypothetical protein TNCV_5019141 [Trichonephila clavipes]
MKKFKVANALEKSTRPWSTRSNFKKKIVRTLTKENIFQFGNKSQQNKMGFFPLPLSPYHPTVVPKSAFAERTDKTLTIVSIRPTVETLVERKY